MKKILMVFCCFICLSFCSGVLSCFAQMPIGVGPGDGDAHSAPLRGIEILAAAGAGYAIKKLHDRQSEE